MYLYYKSAPGRHTNSKVNFKQDELFDLLSYSLSPQVATNLNSGYRLITYLTDSSRTNQEAEKGRGSAFIVEGQGVDKSNEPI